MVGQVLSSYQTLHGRPQPNLLAHFASFQFLKPDNPVHVMGNKASYHCHRPQNVIMSHKNLKLDYMYWVQVCNFLKISILYRAWFQESNITDIQIMPTCFWKPWNQQIFHCLLLWCSNIRECHGKIGSCERHLFKHMECKLSNQKLGGFIQYIGILSYKFLINITVKCSWENSTYLEQVYKSLVCMFISWNIQRLQLQRGKGISLNHIYNFFQRVELYQHKALRGLALWLVLGKYKGKKPLRCSRNF